MRSTIVTASTPAASTRKAWSCRRNIVGPARRRAEGRRELVHDLEREARHAGTEADEDLGLRAELVEHAAQVLLALIPKYSWMKRRGRRTPIAFARKITPTTARARPQMPRVK
jgi:hypothetical protein